MNATQYKHVNLYMHYNNKGGLKIPVFCQMLNVCTVYDSAFIFVSNNCFISIIVKG